MVGSCSASLKTNDTYEFSIPPAIGLLVTFWGAHLPAFSLSFLGLCPCSVSCPLQYFVRYFRALH